MSNPGRVNAWIRPTRLKSGPATTPLTRSAPVLLVVISWDALCREMTDSIHSPSRADQHGRDLALRQPNLVPVRVDEMRKRHHSGNLRWWHRDFASHRYCPVQSS